LEIYTSGSQSIDTFSSWEEWIKWYEDMIIFSLSRLKKGGISCWNVKNFKTDKEYPQATLTIKIHEDNGWKLIKTFKASGSRRPGHMTKISEEITYCFQKNNFDTM
jgi:hypothetical protein